MCRRLFNLSTVLSLVLLVVTVALWVMNAGWQRNQNLELVCPRFGFTFYAESGPHIMVFIVFTGARYSNPSTRLSYTTKRYGFELPAEHTLSYASGPNFQGEFARGFFITYAWAAFFAAILPTAKVVISRASQRKRSDKSCIACGYNLTGNISGVCPECGSEVKASSDCAGSPGAD